MVQWQFEFLHFTKWSGGSSISVKWTISCVEIIAYTLYLDSTHLIFLFAAWHNNILPKHRGLTLWLSLLRVVKFTKVLLFMCHQNHSKPQRNGNYLTFKLAIQPAFKALLQLNNNPDTDTYFEFLSLVVVTWRLN